MTSNSNPKYREFAEWRETDSGDQISGGTPRTPMTTTASSSRNTSTLGSNTSSAHSSGISTPRSNRPSVIVAIVEGRGMARGEIGYASIDLRKPELELSQFPDTQAYAKVLTKMQIADPLEIVMPNTACEKEPTKLFKLLTSHFPNCNITSVQRKYFNEAKGLKYITHLCIPECKAVEMQVADKYYCLATVAALLKYVEFIQHTLYAPNSLKIVFTGSEKTILIDTNTAKRLELIINLRNPKSDHSLYGVLRVTKTPGGARLLRANILQPPSDEATINSRLDCVTELLQNEELFHACRDIVTRFLDTEQFLSLCIQLPKQETIKADESKTTYVIHLKQTLQLVQPLQVALQRCDSELFKAYSRCLEDPRYDQILESICEVIKEDACWRRGVLNMKAQRIFAIKPNINALLDVARRVYAEKVDDVSEMVQILADKYQLPLRATYSSGRGFMIQMPCGGKNHAQVENLPDIFIRRNKHKNIITFTTDDLVKLNDRVKHALNEIFFLNNVILTDLLKTIVEKIGCIYTLTEIASTLDMLVAFAHNCMLSEHVRPEFTDRLAIKQGRHPILEHITPEKSVPNNAYMSEDANFLIITGPNMSGKTTYIKQVALLQVMAQIGCYVPAQYASFRLCDSVFARIGSEDNMEANASTLMEELKDIHFMLSTASDKSLILIDELGKGTSVEEGVGLSYAISEELLQKKAFTLFTTHFPELTQLDTIYPNVNNFHFQVKHVQSEDADETHMEFTHQLCYGATPEESYGIKLAELAGFPPSIVSDAVRIAQGLREKQKANHPPDPQVRLERAKFRLGSRVVLLANRFSTMDHEDLVASLEYLKDRYEQEIDG